MIEFNPVVFSNFLSELNKQGFQPILINFRRSALWSFDAFRILKKTNSKIIVFDKFIDSNEILSFQSRKNKILESIKNNFKDIQDEKIFVYMGISLDSIIFHFY